MEAAKKEALYNTSGNSFNPYGTITPDFLDSRSL